MLYVYSCVCVRESVCGCVSVRVCVCVYEGCVQMCVVSQNVCLHVCSCTRRDEILLWMASCESVVRGVSDSSKGARGITISRGERMACLPLDEGALSVAVEGRWQRVWGYV